MCLLCVPVLSLTLGLKISETLDFIDDLLVDLIGIEPMTSSMPWNSSNRKI